MIRIQTRWIEMAHPSLYQMLSTHEPNSKILFAATQKLVSQEKAKVVHSTILLARSGEKSTVASIREIIHPAELEGSGISGSFTPEDHQRMQRMSGAIRPHPPVFQTRNVGTSLEVEPSWSEDGHTIDLRFAPEWLQMPDMVHWVTHTDAWGETDIKSPVFYSMEVATAVTLTNGQFELINTFSPMDAKGKPDPSRKILLFVKATITPVKP